MKTGWLIGIISAFVIITFIAGVCENAWYGAEAVTKVDVLMRPMMATGVWEGIKAAAGTLFSVTFWNTLWDVLWWNYPFGDPEGMETLAGTIWGIARYAILLPLSLGFVFSLGLAVVRGVSSS